MVWRWCWWQACAVLALATGVATGQEPPVGFVGDPGGQVLVSGDNRVMILDAGGRMVWEHRTGLVHDAWKLANGNVLYADGQSVTEVAPDKKVVWQYRSESKRGDATYACQRLANGNTLVGENSTGRVLEVDAAGKVVFTLQTQPVAPNSHGNQRLARKLDNGNYLVAQKDAKVVKEYRPNGEVVQELKLPNVAFSTFRTPQGTTVVGCISHVLEFDAAGQRVWEFDPKKDAPEVAISAICGVHLLPDGTMLLGMYSANTKDEKGCNFLAINRAKKVLWRYREPKLARSSMAVQMLDKDGHALAAPGWR